jgi:hypothetical protein
MSVAWLAVLLGLGYAVPQAYGLAKPAAYRNALRSFPRSEPWGYVLMLLATAWFLWNLHRENISDFAAFKPVLIAGFAVVGVGACVYLRDFLAVRGLAVLFMLLAKVMVDTVREVETDWRLVVVTWAYVLVVGGMWLTISPHRLREWFEWQTGSEGRLKLGLALRLAFGLGVALLGVTVFRS